MLAKVRSCAVVGLPSAAVRESGERVRSAIANSGFVFPQQRLTVNLAPADLRKEGPAYDLPIALGIMAATRQAPAGPDDALVVGELGLDGSVRHVNGVLATAVMAERAGYCRLFVPQADAAEAALVEGIDVYPVAHLSEIVGHLCGVSEITCQNASSFDVEEGAVYPVDFEEIRGQEHAKRAFEIACAGNHNVRMVGPPGSGKTLMARALPSILPAATLGESLEITRIYSVAGELDGAGPLMRARPFRAPHHTISHAGLVGGRQRAPPGGDQPGAPGRPLSRRAARVRFQEPGEPAAAARGQGRNGQPRGRHPFLSRQLLGGGNAAMKFFGTLGRLSWIHSHVRLGLSSIPELGPICAPVEER